MRRVGLGLGLELGLELGLRLGLGLGLGLGPRPLLPAYSPALPFSTYCPLPLQPLTAPLQATAQAAPRDGAHQDLQQVQLPADRRLPLRDGRHQEELLSRYEEGGEGELLAPLPPHTPSPNPCHLECSRATRCFAPPARGLEGRVRAGRPSQATQLLIYPLAHCTKVGLRLSH